VTVFLLQLVLLLSSDRHDGCCCCRRCWARTTTTGEDEDGDDAARWRRAGVGVGVGVGKEFPGLRSAAADGGDGAAAATATVVARLLVDGVSGAARNPIERAGACMEREGCRDERQTNVWRDREGRSVSVLKTMKKEYCTCTRVDSVAERS
jgi:hypothetical protein